MAAGTIEGNLAPSSSGPGRRPFKAEIAGSNPVGAATCVQLVAHRRRNRIRSMPGL